MGGAAEAADGDSFFSELFRRVDFVSHDQHIGQRIHPLGNDHESAPPSLALAPAALPAAANFTSPDIKACIVVEPP